MPSPFPGMDPYLEARALWPDVHLGLITAIRGVLQPLLLPHYYAHLGERIYFEDLRHAAYPDLSVVRAPAPHESRGGAATLAADEPVILAYELRHYEPFVEIRSASTHEVVTVLEVLSPARKERGRGREEYEAKRRQVLASRASLVEIDLLREPPDDLPSQRPPGDYMACVHRASTPDRGEFYPFTLRQRLPRPRIPLRSSDPDVVLDLPAAFSRAYEEGAYLHRVDYRQPPPPPPLRPQDQTWVGSLVRTVGFEDPPSA